MNFTENNRALLQVRPNHSHGKLCPTVPQKLSVIDPEMPADVVLFAIRYGSGAEIYRQLFSIGSGRRFWILVGQAMRIIGFAVGAKNGVDPINCKWKSDVTPVLGNRKGLREK